MGSRRKIGHNGHTSPLATWSAPSSPITRISWCVAPTTNGCLNRLGNRDMSAVHRRGAVPIPSYSDSLDRRMPRPTLATAPSFYWRDRRMLTQDQLSERSHVARLSRRAKSPLSQG